MTRRATTAFVCLGVSLPVVALGGCGEDSEGAEERELSWRRIVAGLTAGALKG